MSYILQLLVSYCSYHLHIGKNLLCIPTEMKVDWNSIYLTYLDSGMFYDDSGRLNFNLPTTSYKLIKSHLFYLAYVLYCFYVRAAYSTFWGRPSRYRVHFFELQERPLVATKLAGNGRLNFNLPSLNLILQRDVGDWNSIYQDRLGYAPKHYQSQPIDCQKIWW